MRLNLRFFSGLNPARYLWADTFKGVLMLGVLFSGPGEIRGHGNSNGRIPTEEIGHL